MKMTKNNWLKNVLVSLLNLSILGFLFFVGSIIIYEPNNLRGQTGIVIPGDALIYQGRLSGLTVTKDTDKITVESQGQLTLYPVVNDQEVLTGSQIELKVPVLNFQTQIQEISQGTYALTLSKKIIITPQVLDASLSQITQWLIQPLEYNFSIGGDNKGQSLNVFPVRISTLEKGLDASVQTVLSQSPVVGYKANANIASCPNIAQEYNIPFNLSFRAKILDADGNPLVNKTLSATLELPEHNYSETISVTTNNNGIFSYSRTESAIIKVSGGNLVTLTQALSIEGASFVTAQEWWASSPPEEGEPNYGKQNEIPNPKPENVVGKDPVNVATGNVYSIEQDLFIPSKGLPIQFVRTYNSQVDYQGPFGFGWTHSYNVFLTEEEESSGNVRERDENDTLVIFTKNPDGSYNSPAGNHSKLTKNLPDGTFTIKRKHGETLNFNAGGKLISIVDRNQNKIELFYSGNNLTTIVDTSGRNTNLNYDSQGRIIRLTDPLGRSTTYTYDSDNNLSSVTDALGNTTTYEYNSYHCIKTITDPQRGTYQGEIVQSHRYFSYDSSGRCKEFKYDEDIHKITLEYQSDRTEVTDSKGNKTTYYYQEISGVRLVTKIVDPQNYTQEFSWDSDLNKISSTDQNYHTAVMTYDSRGNLTSVKDSLSNLTKFTYEPTYNNVTSITNPLGNLTTYNYDDKGNLLEVIDAKLNKTKYTYDASGNMTTTTDTNGKCTQYEYDTYGNLNKTIGALGNQASFIYDLVGNCTRIIDAKGNSTLFTYDSLNRLTQVTYPDVSKVTYAYDSIGNRISITDPKGNITYYDYDAVNRLVKVVDPLAGQTNYGCDTEGNRVGVTDANRNTTRYNYDSLNRLIETITPLLMKTQFSYDPAGNRISTTDANANLIKYTYDAGNRLIQITYPDISTVSFVYDATGKRTSMTDSQGTTTYGYDELNLLIQLDGPANNDTISYAYDNLGNRIRMVDQDGGATTYTYDALNRLTSLTNPQGQITNYSYDNVGNLIQMSYHNGTKTSYTYDNLNRLLNLVNKTSHNDIISFYTYEYDANGMRNKVVLSNGDYILYTYDALNRLIIESKKDGASGRSFYTYTYTFDPVGNRTSLTKELFQRLPMSPQRTKATSGAAPGPEIEDLVGKNYYTYTYDSENKLLNIDIVRSQRKSVPQPTTRKAANSKSDELLVKFKSGTDEETIRNINKKLGTAVVKKISKIDVYRLRILTGISATQKVEEYKKEPQVEFAEPNYLVYALLTPNDPDFSKQWGLNNTGQTGGAPDSDIDAPEAWDIVTGDPAIVIAVIDTGVDYDHPDLKGRVIAGYDFVNNDEDPQDDHGHGTFVAGIAGAITDNSIGISGTSWYSQIMPVKVLNSSGSGTDADVAHGIIYASDNGAKVINLSLGGSSHSLTLQDAMRYAYGKGVTSVSAAGNDGGPVLYPAAYDEYTIGVAATDHNDLRASFSNYGPEVDVAAPGVDIYSTWWNDTYRTASGTSASTPYVSGLAGLLLAKTPTLSPYEVTNQIKSSSQDVNQANYPGEDDYLGSGRINAYNALTLTLIKPQAPQATITFEYDKNGNQVKKTVTKGQGTSWMTNYSYDYENRLTKIDFYDGSTSQYSYDGVGKRVQSLEEAQLTQYLYDGLNAIIERNASGITQTTYTRGLSYGGGIGSIISALRGSNTSYYHYDGIGSVTNLTDSMGKTIQTYSYDSYGNVLSSLGNVDNPYQFSTKEYSPKSGLIYFGARYYDPKVGRWITPDPSGMIDGPNLYLYCSNNPVNLWDPWGLAIIVTRPIPGIPGRHGYIRFDDGSTVALNRENGKTWVGPEQHPLSPAEEKKWSRPADVPDGELKKNAEKAKQNDDPQKDDVDGKPYDSWPNQKGETNNSNDWVNRRLKESGGKPIVNWRGKWLKP